MKKKHRVRNEVGEFAADAGAEIVAEAAFSALGRILTFPFRVLFRALDGI